MSLQKIISINAIIFIIILLGVSCEKPTQQSRTNSVDPFFLLPSGLTMDNSGNLYIANTYPDILKLSSSGTLTVLVDTNCWQRCGGDGGLAISAAIMSPCGMCIDSSGNIYFSDKGCCTIHKLNNTGYMYLVAGNGNMGYSDDGGLASSAALNNPLGIASDKAGDIYIADYENNRIRKVIASNGNIVTVAGNGIKGYGGDGGPASSAELNNPNSITTDDSLNVYISDAGNHLIRKINNLTGNISTIAGNVNPSSGDSLPALQMHLHPSCLVFDNKKNLYITDSVHIYKLNNTTGYITSIAGNGVDGYSGDGGLATASEVSFPEGIVIDKTGNIIFSDAGNNRIRRIAISTGIITTFLNTR